MRSDTSIELWTAYRQRPPVLMILGWRAWLLPALFGWLLWTLAGCGVKKGDAASALDVARRLEFALCEDHAPSEEDAAACAWAYGELRRLEPAIEDALSAHAGLRQAWQYAKPYVIQIARTAVGMWAPWALPWLPA